MKKVLDQYARRLEAERCVLPGRVAVACRNDTLCVVGPRDLAGLASEILDRLPALAVIVAEPLLPYPALLLRRAPDGTSALVPRDSESRASLHDIPLVTTSPPTTALAGIVSRLLTRRKGCIIQGIGMAAHGSLTVEQAYISWSSLYHAACIKYLEDLLSCGMQLPDEGDVVAQLQQQNPDRVQSPDVHFRQGPLRTRDEIVAELTAVGRATVRMGLVDSFFGNISFAGEEALYISQTSARLDELEQQIDRIPYDRSSTAGITASSELPAHQAIIAATGCRAVLHGHPRFPVVLSFFSEKTGYEGIEQICEIPVVGGEGGQGGLAQTVPLALRLTGTDAVIVRGHGVFSIGREDFRAAFAGLLEVEKRCRAEYGRRLADPPRSTNG